MKKLFGVFFLLLLWQLCEAQPAKESLALARQAYDAGLFEQAAAHYDSLIRTGYRHPDLYYNYGNACYRAGQRAQAVLAYERCLRMAPRHADARHNLKVIQAQLQDQLSPIPAFLPLRVAQSIERNVSPQAWGWLSLLLLWTGLGSAVLFFYPAARNYRTTLFFSAIGLLIAAMFCTWAGQSLGAAKKNSGACIVLAQVVYVKSAPDSGAANIFTIHEGLKATAEDSVAGWKRIRLTDGKSGWVQENEIEEI